MSVDAQLNPSEPQPHPDEQYVTVAASIRRHKLLAAFPVVLFLAAALVYGLVRQPVYTATAELYVSGINLGQPGALNGFSDATQALATSYSRAISADAIVRAVARDAREPVKTVRSRLTASPVADSGVIKISGTAGSASRATRLALAGSTQLQAYSHRAASGSGAASRVYESYARAVLLRERRTQFVDRLQRALATRRLLDDLAVGRPVSPRTRADEARLVRARTRVQLNQLRTRVLQEHYTELRRSEMSTPELTFLSAASDAWSDRWSRLQIALFVAVAAGLLTGAALAALRAGRRVG